MLAWTIPRDPAHYFPPVRVFTLKSLTNASTSVRNNVSEAVSEAVSTSVWGKKETVRFGIRTPSDV